MSRVKHTLKSMTFAVPPEPLASSSSHDPISDSCKNLGHQFNLPNEFNSNNEIPTKQIPESRKGTRKTLKNKLVHRSEPLLSHETSPAKVLDKQGLV
jgi:hypothetical protein